MMLKCAACPPIDGRKRRFPVDVIAFVRTRGACVRFLDACWISMLISLHRVRNTLWLCFVSGFLLAAGKRDPWFGINLCFDFYGTTALSHLLRWMPHPVVLYTNTASSDENQRIEFVVSSFSAVKLYHLYISSVK